MDHSISGLHILLYHYVSIFISIIHCLNYCTFNYCAFIVNLKIKWHQFSSFVLFQDDFSFFRTFAFSQKFGITPSISKVDLVLFFFFLDLVLLIEVVLNLLMNLWRMDKLTILSITLKEHNISLYLFRSFTISALFSAFSV